MYIINDDNDDWLVARKKDGQEVGCIPRNYVTEFGSDLHGKK